MSSALSPAARAVAANLLMAGVMATLVFTNALSLEADLVRSWPVITGLAAWLIGIAALVQTRQWGWYLTTVSALFFSALGVAAAYITLFFHGVPTLNTFASEPQLLVYVALAVVPWITTGLLFHRDVRPFLKATAADMAER
jgi:hypothetical protein